jgi:hypothetical protein
MFWRTTANRNNPNIVNALNVATIDRWNVDGTASSMKYGNSGIKFEIAKVKVFIVLL